MYEAITDILFQWILPFAVMLGLYLIFVNYLYRLYERMDIDIIWKKFVRGGIVAGLIVGLIIFITSSDWFHDLSGVTITASDWIFNTEQAQTAMSAGGAWWQKAIQFIFIWLPYYFRAMVIVWFISTIIFIQSLIWRVQFTRAANIILSVIFMYPYLTIKYLFGHQTPFFDFLQSRLFVAKLKENLNDSYFDALQGKDDFETGAGGTVQSQRIKAATIAIRQTKSSIRTSAGVRRAELVTRNGRETDTDRLIELALKGLGQRLVAPSIRFQDEPVFNMSRGGYVFDSDVAYNSGDVLGQWQSIFINPFAEDNQIRNGGDGVIKTFRKVLSGVFRYVSHLTPPAIYERVSAREIRLYTPDTTAEKSKYKAQSNLDLSLIPAPEDVDTGNDIETQTTLAQNVARERINDVTNALNTYKLGGSFDRVLVGGNTAIYQYTLPRSADLPSDFSKAAEGIANMLKTPDLPIISISAGVLSLSMVNGVNIPVDFRKMITNRTRGMKSIISGIAGVDAMGKNIYVELGNVTPHMILFGKTGTGKTVTIMTILYSIMSAVDPTQLKIAYIDGKGNSFEFMRTDNKDSGNYHPNPFTYAQPADASGDIDYARAMLKHMEKETRRRIELFKQRGISQISEFNKRFPDEALYEILLVVDEFSAITDQDNILKSSELAEYGVIDTFEYLAKMARSVGIRLLLANQTARKEKVPGKISANIGGRISLGVTEPIESDIALPDSGIAVHLINQPGEFYSTMNGIRNAEHGNSPYLSDGIMYQLNNSLERKFGHHDYVVSREEIMEEIYGDQGGDDDSTTQYDVPNPMPTVDTPIDEMLYIVSKYPEWAKANKNSLVFTRNKDINADSPTERRKNKEALKGALEGGESKSENVL